MPYRLTAFAKKDGGVRGVAIGITWRRVVGRTLAKQFMKDFEDECSPFQHALSTRAGTDCVEHMLRAQQKRTPALKIEGIGAYDHVLRSAPAEQVARCTSIAACCAVVVLSVILLPGITQDSHVG